jgi:hypothetical protein
MRWGTILGDIMFNSIRLNNSTIRNCFFRISGSKFPAITSGAINADSLNSLGNISGVDITGSTISASNGFFTRSPSVFDSTVVIDDAKVDTVTAKATDLVVRSNNTTNSITLNDTKATYAGTHEFANDITVESIHANGTLKTYELSPNQFNSLTIKSTDGSQQVQINNTNLLLAGNVVASDGINTGQIDAIGTELSLACGTTPNQAELSLNTNSPSVLYPHDTQSLKLTNHGDTGGIEVKDSGDVKMLGDLYVVEGEKINIYDLKTAYYSVGAQPYNVLAGLDNKIIWFVSSTTTTINLPNTGGMPITHYTFVDVDGTAGTSNITIDAGVQTINGASTFVMNVDYQSVSMVLWGFGNWVVY